MVKYPVQIEFTADQSQLNKVRNNIGLVPGQSKANQSAIMGKKGFGGILKGLAIFGTLATLLTGFLKPIAETAAGAATKGVSDFIGDPVPEELVEGIKEQSEPAKEALNVFSTVIGAGADNAKRMFNNLFMVNKEGAEDVRAGYDEVVASVQVGGANTAVAWQEATNGAIAGYNNSNLIIGNALGNLSSTIASKAREIADISLRSRIQREVSGKDSGDVAPLLRNTSRLKRDIAFTRVLD